MPPSKEKCGPGLVETALQVETLDGPENTRAAVKDKTTHASSRKIVFRAGAVRSNKPLTLSTAQQIAESIVGAVQWNGAEGFCRCPGEDLHTTRTSGTDCKVVCEPSAKADGSVAPGVYCFHDHCKPLLDSLSFQLRSALGKLQPSPRPQRSRPAVARKRELEFNPAVLAKIAAKLKGVDAAWLVARSPLKPDECSPARFLHALYKLGEKVIVFDVYKSQGQHVWTCTSPMFDPAELDPFRTGKSHGVWFLSNPVDGEFRANDQGQESRRSWQSVTSWPYMVVESDRANPAQWLSVLAQMPLRIAAIYESGGKSIHALIRVDAASKAHWNALSAEMKPALVTLGADPKSLSAVRLTRLPGCQRLGTDDKHGAYIRFPEPRMQTLLYLNPHPDRTPICKRPLLRGSATQNGRISN